jgi:hypothetical protein
VATKEWLDQVAESVAFARTLEEGHLATLSDPWGV